MACYQSTGAIETLKRFYSSTYSHMDKSIRGQSELVGSILLAGVVVLAVAAFGISVFNSVDTEDRQLTDISVVVAADSVTVSHAGGEPIAASDLAAVISFDGHSERYNAGDMGVSTPFRTGEQWVISSDLPYSESDAGESVSVTVISIHTGERLVTDTAQIP